MIYSLRAAAAKRRLIEDAGWVALGLAALFAIAVLVMSPLGFDLRVYLEAARAVAEGRSPYAPPDSVRCRTTGCFFYPPPVALLFLPLTAIPPETALALSLVTLCAVAAAVGVRILTPAPRAIRPWAGAALALFFPLLLDISLVNLDFAVVALALAAWDRRDRSIRGGVLLAVAAGLKLVAAPLALFYAAAGRWRQLAWAAATAAAVVLVTIPWVGRYWPEFLEAAVFRTTTGFVGIRPEPLRSPMWHFVIAMAGIALIVVAGLSARRANGTGDHRHALALAACPLLAYGITYPFLVLALPLLAATMRQVASRPALLSLPLVLWLAMEAPLGMESWRFAGYLGTIALGTVLFLPRERQA